MNGAPKHLLVVDDYEDLAELMAELLRHICPFEVTIDVATDGLIALAMARKTPPAIAFLDIDMPFMDGLTAAIAIKAHLRREPPLLIALTGNPGRLASMDVHRAFDHVLPKPVDVDKLTVLLGWQ